MIESIIRLASTEATVPSSTPMPFGDAMSLGGSVTLIGVLVVFAALICLILITWLYPKISLTLIAKSALRKDNRAAKKAAKKAAKEMGNTPPNETAAQKITNNEKAIEEPEIIAVITAAIAAAMGSSSNGIVIRSLKRSGANVSSWGREARNEQVYNRF